MFNFFKKKKQEILDDVSYIKEIKKQSLDGWCYYAIYLAARPYGWQYMIDTSDYINKNDLIFDNLWISEIAGGREKSLKEVYHKSNQNIRNIEELNTEYGLLAIGGISKILNAPLKIMFYNQTNLLQVITPINDDSLIERYCETFIRRSFNTEDAMKLAKKQSWYPNEKAQYLSRFVFL